MNRLRGMIVCAGVSLGLASGMALAVPPVLEKAPKDAMFVVAIPSPAKLDKNIQSMMTAAEINLPIPGIEQMMMMAGVSGGVDVNKSAALVAMPPAQGQEMSGDVMDDRTLVLLPVSDFAAFLQNFEAKPGDAGAVASFDVHGREHFARDLGDGYVVMGPVRDLVSNFKGGNDTIKADMGKTGERIADTADVVVFVNMEVARPFIKEGAQKAREQMADQMAMMGMEGDAPAESPLAKWISDSITNDARAVVGGFKAGGLGATFEMAANFKEASTIAGVFHGGGKASSLLAKLPAMQQYLFAGAIDTSSAAMKNVLQTAAAKAKESAPTGAPGMFTDHAGDADGHAFVIGMHPTMLMGGGVFTNSVSFTAASDPAKIVSNMKNQMAELNGKSFEGMSYEASFKEGGAKVGEKPVDVWQVKMQSDTGDGMSAQAASVLFGPQGGPAGYIAQVNGGIVQTYAKNSALMSAAMKAAGGVGETLPGDTLVKQVGGQLPSNRIAEGYIGTRHIVDLVLPLASMMGVQVDMDAIPAQLPPVGFALAGEGGAAHMSLFLPAPVIKTIWVVGESVGPQLGGMGDMDDMDMEDEEADAPTGQPRF